MRYSIRLDLGNLAVHHRYGKHPFQTDMHASLQAQLASGFRHRIYTGAGDPLPVELLMLIPARHMPAAAAGRPAPGVRRGYCHFSAVAAAV